MIDRAELPKHFPDWSDRAVVCIASGPSLNPAQVKAVQMARARGHCRVIAVNDNWRCAPWADAFYGCDFRWWHRNLFDMQTTVEMANFWTASARAADLLRVNYVMGMSAPGLSRRAGMIHHGGNSGYQAIGLAHQFGATSIALIGYDMQHTGGRSHWFGDHPKELKNAPNVQQWADAYPKLAADLTAEGVAVINCSRETALQCFPRLTLSEFFEGDP